MNRSEQNPGADQAGVYERYLTAVQHAAEAAGAALLIEHGGARHGELLLVSAGTRGEIPELADPDVAAAAIAVFDAADDDAPQDAIRFFSSWADGACILRIAVDTGRSQSSDIPGDTGVGERRRPEAEAAFGQAPACVWIGLYFEAASVPDAVATLGRIDPGAPQKRLASSFTSEFSSSSRPRSTLVPSRRTTSGTSR